MKQIQFRPFIADQDFQRKVRLARNLLLNGEDVTLTLRLRGRENSRPETYSEVLERAVDVLSFVSTGMSPLQRQGGTWRVVLRHKGGNEPTSVAMEVKR